MVNGQPLPVPPRTTALGALAYYVSHADPRHYEPSNITFGIMPPLDRPPRGRQSESWPSQKRALDDLANWAQEYGLMCAQVAMDDALTAAGKGRA